MLKINSKLPQLIKMPLIFNLKKSQFNLQHHQLYPRIRSPDSSISLRVYVKSMKVIPHRFVA